MVVNYKPYYPPVYYSLEIEVTEPEAGTVTGMGRYQQGETVVLHAYANSRGVFQGWYMNGTLLSAEESCTVTVEGDMKVVAKFAMVWQISTAVDPEGSGTTTGAGRYTDGDTVTLSAQSGEGYIFTHWADASGKVVSESTEYSFQASADATLTAYFAVLCTVTIVTNIEGPEAPVGAGKYAYGSTVTVSAQDSDTFTFIGWQDSEGNVLSSEKEYSFQITGDISLIAMYEAYDIPAGYRRVEYIANPNNGYISDPGIIQNVANCKLHIKLDISDTAVNTYLFGNGYYMKRSYKAGSNYQHEWGAYGCMLMMSGTTSAPVLRLFISYYGRVFTTTSSSASGRPSFAYTDIPVDKGIIDITIDFPAAKCTINGEEFAVGTYTYNKSVPGMPFAVFARNYINRTGSTIPAYTTQYISKGKIYALQISNSETGELLNDFVPCVNPENIPGIYDLVNKQFYSSTVTSRPFTVPE